MQTTKKLYVITGANKGIGYAILKGLLERDSESRFIMAIRTLSNGESALKELSGSIKDADKRVDIHELDVSSSKSIESFVGGVKDKYGKVDILINNAGMAFKGDAFDENVVKTTFQTNYYGTVEFTEKLLPYINDNGKVIIVGSRAGLLNKLSNKDLVNRFTAKDLTRDGLNTLAKEFHDAVVAGDYKEKGWPKSAYGISKLLINSYARVLGWDDDVVKRNIQVYALCPGYVNTDMTSNKGTLTPEQGAETPIYLAELPAKIDKDLQGKFFADCKVYPLG